MKPKNEAASDHRSSISSEAPRTVEDITQVTTQAKQWQGLRYAPRVWQQSPAPTQERRLYALYQTDRRDRQMTFDEWLRSREQGGK